jgi:hypothetical protein
VRVVKRFSHVTAMDCDNPEETKFPISLHVKQVISQNAEGSQP